MNGNDERIEKVTKLDAASRQLRTAVRLFFQEGDSVSIHALASSAQELLRDLLKPAGGDGSFYKDANFLWPERKKEFFSIVNGPQNFFKHADRDGPDAVLDFRPAVSEYVLLDCIKMHRELTGRGLVPEGTAFGAWFMLRYPDMIMPGPARDLMIAAFERLRRRVLRPEDKEVFLTMLDLPTESWQQIEEGEADGQTR